ncbi:MAG: hypothetical protein U0271_47960 [Polyangiaceae bacterium]
MSNTPAFDRLKVASNVAIYQGQRGPNKVFGEDVDERTHFNKAEAQARFDQRWTSILLPKMRVGMKCSFESASLRLGQQQQKFLRQDRLLWEFEACGLDFIAQIATNKDGELLEQLWYVPSMDSNPKLLRVVFDTVEERKAFGELAARLGWSAESLGLALVRDFTSKFQRASVPKQPNTTTLRESRALIYEITRGIPAAANAEDIKRWNPYTKVEKTHVGTTLDRAIVKVRTSEDPPGEFLLGAADRHQFDINFGGSVYRIADEGEWRCYEVSVHRD